MSIPQPQQLVEAGWPQADQYVTSAAELKSNILAAYHWMQDRMPAIRRGNGTWAAAMSGDLLVDGRNHLDPEAACAAGLIYMGMGRQTRLPIAESYAAAR